MTADPQLMTVASTVRRSVMSLGRRLRLERPADGRTSLELSVLGQLHRRGPLTPGEIAAAERVQPQTLTRTLGSLEASGLISKAGHPRDGRMILLGLTAAGLDALRRDMAARDIWLAETMNATLSNTELEVLRLAAGLLERVADAAEPARPAGQAGRLARASGPADQRRLASAGRHAGAMRRPTG
jgi:DNA-binding MarR family transcriptional regulator